MLQLQKTGSYRLQENVGNQGRRFVMNGVENVQDKSAQFAIVEITRQNSDTLI